MKSFIYKLAVFLNRILPKVKNSNIKIFIPNGIGDLIMFLPAIKVFIEYYQQNHFITFRVRRKENKKILKFIFPLIPQNKKGRYGMVICNFHCQYNPEDILATILTRAFIKAGHDYGRAKDIFTIKAPLDITKYQPDENMNIAYRLFNPELPFESLIFTPFKAKTYTAVCLKNSRNTDKDVSYEQVINKIQTDKVIILGEQTEKIDLPGKDVICLCGKTDIIEASWIISNAYECFLVESGLAHIASALDVKTTVFYRPGITRTQKSIFHKNIKYIAI